MCIYRTEICTVWSESSLGTVWVAKVPKLIYSDSKDPDQIAQIRTSRFAGWSHAFIIKFTVMIWNFRTDRPGQIVQTQIRLLLEELYRS